MVNRGRNIARILMMDAGARQGELTVSGRNQTMAWQFPDETRPYVSFTHDLNMLFARNLQIGGCNNLFPNSLLNSGK
jgi:hypothetical protein